jgi:hypothetical protein
MKLAKLTHIALGGGVALICAANILPAKAITLLDTRPGSDGLFGAGVGENQIGGQTVGQTFIAPTDNILNNFSFELFDDVIDEGKVNFRAFVAAFDSSTNTISGPILFESGSKQVQTNGYQTFTFGGLNLALNPGQEYIAFVSPLKDLDGLVDSAGVPSAFEFTSPPYQDGGGRLVTSTATNLSNLLTSPFSNGVDGVDMVWTASFSSSAVPEPATILGTLAFGGLGASSWLKRRQKGKKA